MWGVVTRVIGASRSQRHSSAVIVEGIAKVVFTPDEFDQVKPGDILV